MNETEVVDNGFAYVFWILMSLNLVVIALVKSRNPGYFRSLFTLSIFNRQLLNSAKEEIKLGGGSGFLLSFTYFNCFAIIASFYLLEEINLYSLLILMIVVIASLIKLGIIRLISFLSQTYLGTIEHFFNHLLFFQIASLILTPLLIITFFLENEYKSAVYLGLVLVVMFIIFVRELQSLFRAFQARVSILYIILYLCTLELLPLILIIKTFIGSNTTF